MRLTHRHTQYAYRRHIVPSRYWQGHGYLSRTGQSLTPSPWLIAYTPRRGSNPARRKDIVADRGWRGNDKVGLHKVFTFADLGCRRRGVGAREALTRVIHEDRYRVKRQPMVYIKSTHMAIGYHGHVRNNVHVYVRRHVYDKYHGHMRNNGYMRNNGHVRNNSTFCISTFCPSPKHMFAKSAKTTRSTSGNLDQGYMPTPIPDRVKTPLIRQSKTFYQLNVLVDRCFWRFFA